MCPLAGSPPRPRKAPSSAVPTASATPPRAPQGGHTPTEPPAQHAHPPVTTGSATSTSPFLPDPAMPQGLFWNTADHTAVDFSPHSPAAGVWDALAATEADPFCCASGWHIPFHEAFAPKRPLLCLAEKDSLCLFAESWLDNTPYLTPIEAHWCFGNPLLGPHAIPLLLATLPTLACHYTPRFPVLVLSGIRPYGALAQGIVRLLGRHFALYLQEENALCTASLEGGVDGYLSRRSANHRAKLKKARRRAAAAGVSYQRLCPHTPMEAAHVYARMLAVEQQSWKGLGHCGMTESPAREFYAAMIARLSLTARARVIFARHNETDIGFIFGAMAGAVYRGQQFSYSHAWQKASLGNLLQLEQILWLCEEGAARYDMGPITGPRMEYKRHWTEQSTPIQTWVLQKN